MSDKHLSSQFDAALNLLSSKLLEMDGLVESQIAAALDLLNAFDESIAVNSAKVRVCLDFLKEQLSSGPFALDMNLEIDA